MKILVSHDGEQVYKTGGKCVVHSRYDLKMASRKGKGSD